MRHKEVYGVNVPTGLKYVLDFGISLVSEKIRKRIQVFQMYPATGCSLSIFN